jgi:hypothetical protein
VRLWSQRPGSLAAQGQKKQATAVVKPDSLCREHRLWNGTVPGTFQAIRETAAEG